MNELILQQLRLDFQSQIRIRGQTLKDTCYSTHAGKKTLDGVFHYAQCIRAAKQQLQRYERRGKSRLLFMEMSGDKKKEFNLVEHVSGFVEEFGLVKDKDKGGQE